MLDLLKLKAARVQADVSVKEIATCLGLNEVTVYRKFNGESEFTLSEVMTLKEMLKLDTQTFCAIFFTPELTETQEEEG